MANTFQTGIHEHTQENLTQYALMMSGLNVTRDALMQYDPLRTGYGRLFMIRKPIFVDNKIPTKMKKFKHILEYCNKGVSGISNISVETDPLTGGYAGRSMEIPTIAKDDTNTLTIKTYEFSGSPVREVIQYWINGVMDIQTGFSHYYYDPMQGENDVNYGLPICQANQTAEFIYVVTDQSGRNIEYACMFANCFPKECKLDHFNYESGTHDLVEMDIDFTCTKYDGPQINEKAAQLLAKYQILVNSLDFNSGYSNADIDKLQGTEYDKTTGKLVNSK